LKKFLIAIPARLSSKRLPDKILADINGKTMLQHVIERCDEVNRDVKIVVCTDSNEIVLLCEKLGYQCILTSEKCTSGTERIASVINELLENIWEFKLDNFQNNKFQKCLESTVIINVQGDQPLLDPKIIEEMIDIFLSNDDSPEVLTPIYKLKSEEIHNPNVVKTLITHKNRIIYFSRSPIPYMRDEDSTNWHNFHQYWGHVGMYGFSAKVLKNWFSFPYSKLENVEKLEQLRLIEQGINIEAFQVKCNSISVDTIDQLNKVRKLMK
tara:strand:- start:20232 stop:21035 length:804 start_codon:yes stop_codon:yes gene_type:complete